MNDVKESRSSVYRQSRQRSSLFICRCENTQDSRDSEELTHRANKIHQLSAQLSALEVVHIGTVDREPASSFVDVRILTNQDSRDTKKLIDRANKIHQLCAQLSALEVAFILQLAIAIVDLLGQA